MKKNREQFECVAVQDALRSTRLQPTWTMYLARLDHWLAWWLELTK